MKRKVLKSLLVVVLALSAGCSKRATDPKEQIIARVNGESVYTYDFLINFTKLKGELDEISQKNPKLIEDVKTRALNDVIIMTILRQEAEKRQIQIAKEEVEGRLANWKEGYPPGGFEEMLRKQHTTEALLKRRIEDQILIEKLTAALFSAETMVSDEEMNQYYNTHQNEFFRPPRVHAFQIVVPTVEEAKKISQEIASGKITFESAARKYSLSPDAATGGDLGFFSRNEKIAAFNEAFSLRVGEISKPIKSRYGVHLLKVVEKQPARKLKYADAKNEVLQAVKKQKEIAVFKEWVAKMLKDGEIYRNETIYATLN